MNPSPRIIGVSGPKGGVGKTTISANLAMALARAGARVVVMDLDLGSANLHVIFGLKDVPYTLDDFLLNKVPSLENVVMETDVPGLRLICGGNVPGIASLPYQRKLKLVRHLTRLDCDFLLLDLAAGVSNNVVDFSLLAWKTLLVTTPDIPSLISLYSFLKTLVYRRLAMLFRQAGSDKLLDLLEKIKDAEANPDLKTMEGFYGQAAGLDPALARQARTVLDRLDPVILVNRVRDGADLNAGKVIGNLMEQFLSLRKGEVLSVREDSAVGKAAARMKLVMGESPQSDFAFDMARIVHALGVGR